MVEISRQAMNSTYSQSAAKTPFELLIGTKMHTPDQLQITKLVEDEMRTNSTDEREEMRKTAKEYVSKIQEETIKGNQEAEIVSNWRNSGNI